MEKIENWMVHERKEAKCAHNKHDLPINIHFVLQSETTRVQNTFAWAAAVAAANPNCLIGKSQRKCANIAHLVWNKQTHDMDKQQQTEEKNRKIKC